MTWDAQLGCFVVMAALFVAAGIAFLWEWWLDGGEE
jgi:hypothetical protein